MSETTETHSEPATTTESAMELVTRATKDGAASACEAAKKSWEATSLFACRFMYTTCYTISYGVVFPAVFVAQSIPKNNAAVRGLIEGAQAARTKVGDIKTHGSVLNSTQAAPAMGSA